MRVGFLQTLGKLHVPVSVPIIDSYCFGAALTEVMPAKALIAMLSPHYSTWYSHCQMETELTAAEIFFRRGAALVQAESL